MTTPPAGNGETRLTPAPAAPGDTPAEIGLSAAEERYAIVRHIASGGMGDVYEVHDRDLDRRVAMKKIHPDLVASAEKVERFRREAMAAARLDHPNIVPVHDTGRHAGRQFFTMALVDGQSLAEVVRAQGPMAPDAAVRLMIPIVEAVGYAHERKLIHRDLKPDNVLIDAHGRPRVTDFGLARQLVDPGDLTGTAQLLGTPRYMAPEQVRPGAGPVGPATDLYALGGILVFLLTGRAPVAGDSVTEVLLNVLDQPPLLPCDSRADVPAAVNEICRRCLQKKPADRFPSAEALCDALAATLPAGATGSLPVAAVPPARPPRRTLLAVAAAVAVGLLLAGVAAVAFKRKPAADAHAGRPAEDRHADVRRGDPKGPPGTPKQPSAAPRSDEAAPPAAKEVPKAADPPAVRTGPESFTLAGHAGRAWVAFAPDSRSLLSWGDDATLRVWDAATGKPVKQLLDAKTETMALRASPDGKTVAAALAAGTARVWTLPDWEERVIYRDPAQGVTAVAFSPDGARLAVGTDGGALKVFDVKSGKELAECVGHSARVLARALYFTPDGTRIVSASRDGSVRVWDAASGKKLHVVPNRKSLWAVVPTPDAARVLTMEFTYGGFGGPKTLWVLDTKTGAEVKGFGENWVDDFAFSADRKVLWKVDGTFDLRAWDLERLKEVAADPKVRGTGIAFAAGGAAMFVTAGTQLRVYTVQAGGADLLRTVQEHRKPITSLCLSPDGRRVATADEGGTIKVWGAPALTRPK